MDHGTKLHAENKRSQEITDKIGASDFEGAYQILKKNPVSNITMDEGMILLSNIDKVVPFDQDDIRRRQVNCVKIMSYSNKLFGVPILNALNSLFYR